MPDKILIVDDENHIRESTMRLLQRKGYETTGAGSGAEALEKLAKESFDLVLLDIRMPGMSGLELLRRAKEMDPDIMALIMTGYGTVESAVEALELGALGFVHKPIPIDELTKAIGDTISKGRLLKENARLQALMPLFGLSKAFLLDVDENNLLQLVLDTVVADTEAKTAQILLKDEEGSLVMKAACGLPIKADIGKIVTDKTATKAMSALEPVIESGTEDSSEQNKAQRSGCKVYVPLIVRGTAIGVLKAEKLTDTTPFKKSDIEFLITLCSQAAIAIANARLFESVQRKQAEVEELLKRVINTTENERLRLSLELHDGPVQSIVASQYAVEACMELIGKSEINKIKTKLHGVQEMLAQSVQGLRWIVRDLHPPILGQSGLVPAIQDYISNIERYDKISCHLELRGTVIRLDSSTERGVYYVAREALTNVKKHADALDIRVFIEYQDDNLIVKISDNGKGFDLSAYNPSDMDHVGVRSMNERAMMLNGSVVINSKPGEGTSVKLTVPIIKAETEKSKPEDIK